MVVRARALSELTAVESDVARLTAVERPVLADVLRDDSAVDSDAPALTPVESPVDVEVDSTVRLPFVVESAVERLVTPDCAC